MNVDPAGTCPACDADLSRSSGVVCPVCGWVRNPGGNEGRSDGRQGDSARSRRWLLGSALCLFAPLLLVPSSLAWGGGYLAAIGFFGSPVFGAVAGVLFGTYLNLRIGSPKWLGAVFAVVGLVVCPILAFCGCVLGGKLS